MPGIRGLWRAYRREIGAARERISSGSQVITTACGPIEYAVAGDGPATILAVHGAGGGFDQGLDLCRPFVHSGFRVIAPSRFGYLRSPLPPDASPAAQADAFAALLDTLNVHRVAVIGVSAGGPSAMQFAIRHPSRTAALVLLVPLAYPAGHPHQAGGATPKRMPVAAEWLLKTVLSSDLLFWTGLRFAPRVMTRTVLGTMPAALDSASVAERARVEAVRNHILPISPRRAGLTNDAAVAAALTRYELEDISAPALIFAVTNCLYGTYEGARYSAAHISGARLVSFSYGGHLFVGHDAEVTAEIETFLTRTAPLARAG